MSKTKRAATISLTILPCEVLDSTTRENVQFITIGVEGILTTLPIIGLCFHIILCSSMGNRKHGFRLNKDCIYFK